MPQPPAAVPAALTDARLAPPSPLVAALAQAAAAAPEPPGGGSAVRTAAAGYWTRRGVPVTPERVLLAPGPGPLLAALLAAAGGDLLLARPTAAWHAPLARLFGRRAFHVPAPAECCGVPDPVALLEAVRRVRADGADPRLLVLAVVDDPTGTVAQPEMLHEVCEVASDTGLLVVSDETYRDTLHDPHTVFVSPAETLPERTVVLTDTAAALLPAGWPAALAAFPATGPAARLSGPARVALSALGAPPAAPFARAAELVLSEPAWLRERTAAANRLHAAVAAAAHRVITASGALCRPPQAGFQLYPDFEPLRPALAAQGVAGPDALERRLPAALAGHRFGDDPSCLRVRVATSALYGDTPEERDAALWSADPVALPHVAAALAGLEAACAGLAAG